MSTRGQRPRRDRGGSIVRYVYIGLIVAFTALVLLFKVQNLETVTVSLFSSSISLPVSVLVVGIYLLGMFTGGFVARPAAQLDRGRARSALTRFTARTRPAAPPSTPITATPSKEHRLEQLLGSHTSHRIDVHLHRLPHRPVPDRRRSVPGYRNGRRHQGAVDHRAHLPAGADLADLHPRPRSRHGRTPERRSWVARGRMPRPTSATSRASPRRTRSPPPRRCSTPGRSMPTSSPASRPRRSADPDVGCCARIR